MRNLIALVAVVASVILCVAGLRQVPNLASGDTPVHPKVKCPPNCSIAAHGTLGPSRIAWVK